MGGRGNPAARFLRRTIRAADTKRRDPNRDRALDVVWLSRRAPSHGAAS